MDGMKLQTMKKLIVFLFMLPLFHAVHAQMIELPMDENDNIVYMEVVNVPGKDSIELAERAVFHLDRMEETTLLENTTLTEGQAKDQFIAGKKQLLTNIEFTVVVEVKEGRYRIQVKDIAYTPEPTPRTPQPITLDADDQYQEYRTLWASGKGGSRRARFLKTYFFSTDRIIKDYIESLKLRMLEPAEENDW